MKKLIQKNILPPLMKLNAEHLFRLIAQKKGLNIFYHGVVKQDSTSIFPRHITTSQFEQHIKYLKRKFNIISMHEMFEMYKENITPDKWTITVSFDDGYANNLENALEIIEKHKVKTTFFISSICIENPDHIMWSDVLSFIRIYSPQVIIDNIEFEKIGKFGLYNKELDVTASDYIKKLSPEKREKTLERMISNHQLLKKMKSIPKEYWKLLDSNQLKELASSEFVDIGSHGHLHYNLGNIALVAAIEDMKKSKQLLSNAINQNIDLLSYPDGSYTKAVMDAAENLGYTKQVAVNYKHTTDDDDKRIINRWGVSSTTTFETIAFTLNKAFIKNSF